MLNVNKSIDFHKMLIYYIVKEEVINMTRLKEIREEKGISQRELAKRINISAPRYNQYENNKRNLPPKIALLLAKELGVTLDDIYS